METVKVDVASAWASKINWTQVVAIGSSLSALYFGHELPAQTQAAIVVGIQAVQALVTFYFRTFKTTTITPSSAAAMQGE
jgi:hypothetical protein